MVRMLDMEMLEIMSDVVDMGIGKIIMIEMVWDMGKEVGWCRREGYG